MLPNETPGPPPEQFSKNTSQSYHFGAILEPIWEPILLTLGTFFDKNEALKSHRISNTFFLDFGSDLGRPDTQSDRAGSIQTHVGTFPKICVFCQILLHVGLQNCIHLTLWDDFVAYRFYIEITSEKIPKINLS